jgi:hypothetical protein
VNWCGVDHEGLGRQPACRLRKTRSLTWRVAGLYQAKGNAIEISERRRASATCSSLCNSASSSAGDH